VTSLGDAWIDVHANTERLGPEIEAGTRRAADESESRDDFGGIVRAADRAGGRAGDGFGRSFIRDASGRLRDERGRFVAEGDRLGREVGDRIGDSIGDSMEKKTKGRIQKLGSLLAPAWIKTIGVWIAAAAPAAIQLAGTLAPAVGILAAIVPLAIGGAAALGILKVAFGGLSDIVKESTTNVAQFNKDMAELAPSTRTFVKTLIALKPVLHDLKLDIQGSFFAAFNDTNFNVINNALKTLNWNLQAVAYTLGGQLSQAANSVLSGRGLGLLNTILGNFDDTLLHLGPILSNFLISLLTIGKAAGPLLESLAGGLDKATAKFAVFITKASQNGSLKKFFDDALIAGDQLLKLAGSLLSIIGSLLEAGKSAGGGNTIILFFQQLAGIFKQLNDSGALAAFFKVFNTFFGSVAAIVKPLLPLVSKLISLFGGELVKVLTILTPPLVTITTAIADALIPVLPSLEKAIDSLLPAISEFASILADVFKQVTPELSTVFIDLFESLAQTFIDLAPSIRLAIPVLGQLAILLVNLLSTQTIAALQIFALVLPVIAKAINLYLVPQLNTLYGILKVLNIVFSEFVIPFVTGFATMAVQEFDALGKIAGKVGKFFEGVGGDIADFFTKTIPKWFGKIGDFFTHLPETLEKLLKKAIKQAFDTVLVAIGVGIGLVIFTFTKLPGKVVNAIGDLGGKLKDFVIKEFHKANEGFMQFLSDAEGFARSIPKRIENGLSSLGSTIKRLFKEAWDTAVDTVKGAIDKVVGYVHDLPHKIESFTAKLVASGIKIVSGFLSGLSHPGKIVNSISDTVFGFLKDKINYVITKLNEGIDKVGHFVPGGLPHIPKLARGAFLKHPTLALIAENNPEVVLPTDDVARARQLLNESGLARSLDFHSSAPNVLVSVRIGDQELNQIVDTRVTVANNNTARQLAFGTRSP
jgi:phage-related protein